MAVLRPLVAVAAAFAVLANTWGALVVWAAFEVHREHVAEHLCENPGSDCDGMCFLADRMEAHHGHDEPPSAPAVVPTAPTLVAVAPAGAAVPPDRWREASPPGFARGLDPSAGAPGEVFRPPRG